MENITVYPNPTSGNFELKISDFDLKNSFEIEVVNSVGQIILFKKISSSHEEVDLSPYSKGIYFLKIKSKEYSGLRKLVIE